MGTVLLHIGNGLGLEMVILVADTIERFSGPGSAIGS